MFARRSAVLLLCLTLLLPACGPAPSSAPTLTSAESAAIGEGPATEPAKIITSEPGRIVLMNKFPGTYGQEQKEAAKAMLARVQQYISSLGWQAQISIRDYSGTDLSGASDFGAQFDAIRKDVASGEPADGYQVTPDIAKSLMAEGLTQDAGPLCKQSAPLLCQRFQALQQKADGIPMWVMRWTKNRPAVLYMEKSVLAAYGKPIDNVDDVLTFLESEQHAIYSMDFNMGTDIFDVWAAQQGYYSLVSYGLPSFFYARMDDPSCAPVPLERIKGFEDAFQRIRKLEHQSKIIRSYESLGSLDASGMGGIVCGYLGPLARQVDIQWMQKTGKAGADYTALALDGCTAPALDEGDPYIYRVLAVPAASKHGDTVAAFCQWALTTAEGYGLLNYGKQDVDYRLTDRGIEYLKDGAPLGADDWKAYFAIDYGSTLPAMCTIEGMLFRSDDLERANIYEADNAEELIVRTQPVFPPIWKIKELGAINFRYERKDYPFNDIIDEDEYNEVLSLLRDVMTDSDQKTHCMKPDDRIAPQLALLKTLEPELDKLISEFQERLNSMMRQK